MQLNRLTFVVFLRNNLKLPAHIKTKQIRPQENISIRNLHRNDAYIDVIRVKR